MTHLAPAAMARTIGFALAALIVAAGAAAQSAEPVRLSATVAGERSVIEVRDLSRAAAEEAIRVAFAIMAETIEALDPETPGSDIARLNEAAGAGPQLVEQEFLTLLQRTLGFCLWSQRASGPLGGQLYAVWEASTAQPSNEMLRGPTQSAGCENLVLRPETREASLASGCRLDLRHFSGGFAVDRAVDHLQSVGAGNLWVEHGSIVRAVGPGANGAGWLYALPVFAGMSEGLEPVHLRDRSLAAVSAHRGRFQFGDNDYSAYLDQRTGQPSRGVVAALVSTTQALDAQALATAVMITGNREGQLRLATVVPTPSALWLLGDGAGEPLLTTYKWSALTTY